MPTIAKTKKYRELDVRFLKLTQLYSVFSELRLHTNKAISKETAEYYNKKLYIWGDSGAFLTASLESMMQVFYIELEGLIGAYWDPESSSVKLRKNEAGSLGSYLHDDKRTSRKKEAIERFEKLLKDEIVPLKKVNDVRHKLAHFQKLSARNKSIIPNDVETKRLLNGTAEVLFLLGYQKWNKPHYIEKDNEATESTQKTVDKLIEQDEKAVSMREKYLKKRGNWYSH